jgi:cytoskeletal protein RodZ
VIALGLILVLIAVFATVFAVVASGTASTAMSLTGFGVKISATPLALFIAGAVSVFLFAVGFALVTRGTRRRARTHKELKQLRKEQPTPAAGGSTADDTTESTASRRAASSDTRTTRTSDDSTHQSTDARGERTPGH